MNWNRCFTAKLLAISLIAPSLACAAPERSREEFVGPFSSWKNVKADFGAVGDGKADDTAAIQKALEALRFHKDFNVLYFPAGTYRITDTIQLLRTTHEEANGVNIIGEDPLKTIICWDGPADKTMLFYNPWYSVMSRLTLDGFGRAKTAIQHGERFSTANEFSDLIIRNVQFGIEAGIKNGIAETAVLRCRFYRCAKAGISIQDFNSLDWWIWHCWFEDCGVGVSNEFGSGNFHTYQNTFVHSTDTDISIRHCGNFSFFGNTSIGSHRFFHAKRAKNWKDTETWGAQVVLQDNVILDPTDATPIVIEGNGPTLILDNTMRVAGNGPIVRSTPPSDIADVLAIGNRWTVGAMQVKGRVTELDNTVVAARAIADVTISPAPFLPHVQRPVFELQAGAGGDAIQQAIDKAAAMKGQRPVVYLPMGDYAIGKTLVIPAGCDLQMIGTGAWKTSLRASGLGNAPLLRVQGPTHANFRNLSVEGSKTGVGILVENCDQEGSRIFGEQVLGAGVDYGMVIEGLTHAQVELHGGEHEGVQVVGAGPATQPWTFFFGGTAGRNESGAPGIPLYDVQQGGRLYVRDMWCEGGSWRMFNFTGSGEFAYLSGLINIDTGDRMDKKEWEKDVRKTTDPENIDGFKGKISLVMVSLNNTKMRIAPPTADLKLLLFGSVLPGPNKWLADPEVKGHIVTANMKTSNGTGGASADGVGKASPEYLREMLAALRTVKPRPDTELPDSATDVRLFRVWAHGLNGIRVQANPEK